MVFGKSKSKKTSSAAVKQRNRRLWIGGGVLCLIAMGFVIGGVYAKYTYSRQGKSTVNAREFYFTSTELDGSTYELNAGTKSVSFHLNNFEDELRVSADDIQYAVKVGEVEKETGTIAGKSAATKTVTLTDLEDGKSYEVTVTARNKKSGGVYGYEKILTATFAVKSAPANVYQNVAYNSAENYYVLTVWTENISGKAVITFPDGVIPDNTDPAMVSVQTNGKSFTDESSFAQTYASKTYRFFGNAEDAANQFAVAVNGVAASDSTP